MTFLTRRHEMDLTFYPLLPLVCSVLGYGHQKYIIIQPGTKNVSIIHLTPFPYTESILRMEFGHRDT